MTSGPSQRRYSNRAMAEALLNGRYKLNPERRENYRSPLETNRLVTLRQALDDGKITIEQYYNAVKAR